MLSSDKRCAWRIFLGKISIVMNAAMNICEVEIKTDVSLPD